MLIDKNKIPQVSVNFMERFTDIIYDLMSKKLKEVKI